MQFNVLVAECKEPCDYTLLSHCNETILGERMLTGRTPQSCEHYKQRKWVCNLYTRSTGTHCTLGQLVHTVQWVNWYTHCTLGQLVHTLHWVNWYTLYTGSTGTHLTLGQLVHTVHWVNWYTLYTGSTGTHTVHWVNWYTLYNRSTGTH